jgi:tetratricopeptide (TPR) repeat protein
VTVLCRSLRAAVLALVAASWVAAQGPPDADAAGLLGRAAETAGDSGAYAAAMLDAFAALAREPAFNLAGRLFVGSLAEAPPPAGAADRLRAIRDDRAEPGSKRAIAAMLRDLLLTMQGDVAALEAERCEGGGIRDFLVVGPFGFSADSLAGLAFPPEREIDLAATYDGYDGKVGWRPYRAQPGMPASDPFDVLFPKAGAAYALAQIHVPEERQVWITLGVRGSAELWIDGRHALAVDRRREFVPRFRFVAARLPAGWHRILVKTTESGRGGFELGLRGADFGPLALRAHGAPDAGIAIEQGSVLHAVGAPASGLGEGGAFVASDVRDRIPMTGTRAHDLAAAAIWSDSGLEEVAYAVAEKHVAAKDLGPGEIWAISRLLEAADEVPENARKTMVLDLAKRSLEQRPGFAPAVVALARNEAKNDRAEEAVRMLRGAIAWQPKCVALWDAELRILEDVGFESDVDTRLDAALAACPDAPALVRRRLGRLEGKRATAAWMEAARRAVANDASDHELSSSLASRLLAAGRFEDLAEVLAIQRRLLPHDAGILHLEAARLRERGDAAGEARALEAIAALHPRETQALETLAARSIAAGDEAAAIRHLERALSRDPDLHHARRLLRELRPAAKDVFDEFRVDTREFLAKAPGPDAYPDSRIVLLFDQVILRVFADGSAEQETHQLHRLQDPRGKEDLGTVWAEGDVAIVQTITPDGRALVPNQIGRGAFEMAGLEPGAIVERRYRRFIDRFRGHPEDFGGFYFQDTGLAQPFHHSRYVVVVPKALGLEPVAQRFDAEFRREDRGDDVLYEFLLERMPRIQREAMMPEAADIVPHVELRRPDAWNRVNRRYLDAYEAARRPTPPIDEAAAKAAGDAADPVERARRLYEFVMDTVKSDDGNGSPTETLLERSGDRFPLYLALLRAARVPHALAMGRPQERVSRPIRWEMVREDLFEVPLVRVEGADGRPVYVSTQLRYLPFGQLGYDLTDAPVFVTSDDGGRIDKTPPAPLEAARTATFRLDLALDGSGVAHGTARVAIHGPFGAMLKEEIERIDKKRFEQVTAQMVLGPIGRLAPRPKGPARVENGTSRDGPLAIELDVEVRQLVRKTEGGGTIGLPLAPLNLARAFVDRKERRLPFVFHQYVVQDDEATIELDPAWRIEDLPQAFEKSGPIGGYKLLRSQDGARLVIRREVRLTPADLPASEFPGVASFAREVDEAEARKITLKRETE